MRTNHGENGWLDNAFRSDRSSLSFLPNFPDHKLANPQRGFKLGCVNFWCRPSAVARMNNPEVGTPYPEASPNLKLHVGSSRTLSTFTPDFCLLNGHHETSLRSTPIPAGLHLGGLQPFHRLRDHPFVAVWIPKQGTPVPVEMGFERLQHRHSGTDTPCSEGIRIRDEETKANPRSQR